MKLCLANMASSSWSAVMSFRPLTLCMLLDCKVCMLKQIVPAKLTDCFQRIWAAPPQKGCHSLATVPGTATDTAPTKECRSLMSKWGCQSCRSHNTNRQVWRGGGKCAHLLQWCRWLTSPPRRWCGHGGLTAWRSACIWLALHVYTDNATLHAGSQRKIQCLLNPPGEGGHPKSTCGPSGNSACYRQCKHQQLHDTKAETQKHTPSISLGMPA